MTSKDSMNWIDIMAEDLFSAGQVQMASMQTGKKLPKNYADNRVNEAKALIQKHLKIAELKGRITEIKHLADDTLTWIDMGSHEINDRLQELESKLKELEDGN